MSDTVLPPKGHVAAIVTQLNAWEKSAERSRKRRDRSAGNSGACSPKRSKPAPLSPPPTSPKIAPRAETAPPAGALKFPPKLTQQVKMLSDELTAARFEICELKAKLNEIDALKVQVQALLANQQNAKPNYAKVVAAPKPARRHPGRPPLRERPAARMAAEKAEEKAPAVVDEGQRIVSEGICKQLGVGNLELLRNAKFTTRGGNQTILDFGGCSGVTLNSHGCYIDFKESSIKTKFYNNGPSHQKYFDRMRIHRGPSFYKQLRNTTRPNPPPGPFACWTNDPKGYGNYVPGTCYLGILNCTIQLPGKAPVRIDPRPIQAQLRRLDNYVGSRSWDDHDRRVRALKRRSNRC